MWMRQCLDWEQLTRRLTTDAARTNLFVVPMSRLQPPQLRDMLAQYQPRFTSVLAFKPTGWTFSSAHATGAAGACCGWQPSVVSELGAHFAASVITRPPPRVPQPMTLLASRAKCSERLRPQPRAGHGSARSLNWICCGRVCRRRDAVACTQEALRRHRERVWRAVLGALELRRAGGLRAADAAATRRAHGEHGIRPPARRHAAALPQVAGGGSLRAVLSACQLVDPSRCCRRRAPTSSTTPATGLAPWAVARANDCAWVSCGGTGARASGCHACTWICGCGPCNQATP
jgi:hypothetical protein